MCAIFAGTEESIVDKRMTFRERTLHIFRRLPVDNVVYQPRIEHWYNVNKRQGTLPPRYQNMSLLDVYDDLGCSLRTYNFFNPCLKFDNTAGFKAETFQKDGVEITRWTTPVGSVETHRVRTALAHRTIKYPVESPQDAGVIEYVLLSREPRFDLELFEKNDHLMGDRAAPMIYLPRVNLQRLFLEYMGFERTIFALQDEPALVKRLISVIDESDEAVLNVVAQCPVEIINFGDNLDQNMLSPPLFEEYVLPAYRRRVEKLKAAGKSCHAHWDGSVKLLLPYAERTGLDGIEALTPIPQGDVTIEEMKDALGDMILLDGIPMTCFLPHEDEEELEETTRRIIETFSPNLVLGVSDEPSPVCDIERVRRVAEILREYDGVVAVRS